MSSTVDLTKITKDFYNGNLIEASLKSVTPSAGTVIFHAARFNSLIAPEQNKEIKKLFREETNRGGVKPVGHSFERTQFDYDGN